jgi:transposase
LQRAQFGRRSENFDPEPLRLTLEDIEQVIPANEADEDKKHPAAAQARAEKRRSDRGALPARLSRVDVTIEPDDANCPCWALMHIGKDTSQRLDVISAQFRVLVDPPLQKRLPRLRGGCGAGAGSGTAGLPTEAMVAHVLVAEYAWHLLLYRQAQMLLAQGLDVK